MTESKEINIDNLFENLNKDITNLLNCRLTPLILDLKSANSNLDIIKNILFSLPEYKDLLTEFKKVKEENIELKYQLNNSGIQMQITEKSSDKVKANKELDYSINTDNKIINFKDILDVDNKVLQDNENENDSDIESTEESTEITESEEEEIVETTNNVKNEMEEQMKIEKNTLKEINEDKETEQEEADEEETDGEEADGEEADGEEADGEEEADVEEEEDGEEAEDEKEKSKETSDKQEEDLEGEEEDEEVFEIDINGKTYFTTGKENGIVYEYIEEEDDIGDKVGEFKNGELIWKTNKV